MLNPFRSVLIGALVAVVWMAAGSEARAQEASAPAVRDPGAVANVFETLDPEEPLDAVRITVPPAWTVESVRLLRYGTTVVPASVRPTEAPGTHLVTAEQALTGPHDLVLRVRLPETSGTFEWELQTLARKAVEEDTLSESPFRTVERRTREMTVESPPPPDPTNRALSLKGASEPLVLHSDALPPLGQTSSFTIEFWLRTNGLDEVILSTWNGEEAVSYPAEFVVDQGGRLRFYTGRPGEHRALRTGQPVADDAWHHVAAVYDARRSRLRLVLDGRRADSLRNPGLPIVTGGRPLALGGRVPREQGAVPSRLFSGHLDELRIWAEARSLQVLRRTRSRPFVPTNGEEAPRVMRRGFDTEESDATDQWPDGAERVPTTLSFRSRLRNLRAQTDDRTVTLRWAAKASDVDTFVVERSADGTAFRTVARRTPSQVRRTTSSDVPEFTYTEEGVPGQVVFYRIRLEGPSDRNRPSGTIKIGLGKDDERASVKLLGNFPNPFSERTTVAYEVNERTPVTVTVWNLQGHQIATLADAPKDPGYHEAPFTATDLPSGTYFVRLKTPTDEQSDRMVLLK